MHVAIKQNFIESKLKSLKQLRHCLFPPHSLRTNIPHHVLCGVISNWDSVCCLLRINIQHPIQIQHAYMLFPNRAHSTIINILISTIVYMWIKSTRDIYICMLHIMYYMGSKKYIMFISYFNTIIFLFLFYCLILY